MASKTKVLAKVSDILYCFTPEEPTWTVTNLSKKLGIPVTTLYGLLTDLVCMGFLEQCSYSKEYKVGLRFMEMGERFTNNFELNNIAHGVMRELTTKINYLVGLSILHKGWMYVSMSTLPLNTTNTFKYVGPKLPAYQTAGGKAILASLLPEQQQEYFSKHKTEEPSLFYSNWDKWTEELGLIQEQGYAFAWSVDDKNLPFSVGAPIFGRNRQVLAGLVVISPYNGFSEEELPTIIRNVVFSANEISMRCGHLSFSLTM